MYGINRLQRGCPSVVFVISLIWFKTNAAMNLRASCSWPPAVMFSVTFIRRTERSDLPWTVIKLWFISTLTCIHKIVTTLILCICTLHRLTVRLHFYRQKNQSSDFSSVSIGLRQQRIGLDAHSVISLRYINLYTIITVLFSTKLYRLLSLEWTMDVGDICVML